MNGGRESVLERRPRMATRFHLGAKELRGALSTYAKRFGLLEIPLGTSTAPSLATLRKYRKEVPPTFEFSLILPPVLSTPRPGPALDAALASATEAINALGARCVVLRTSLEVTPSQLWRSRVGALIERLPRDVTTVAWEPSGLWEAEDVAAQAEAWKVVPVVDAIQDGVPRGSVAYLRLRALGEIRNFGPTVLERVVAAIGDRRDAYIVFETAKALDEAKALRRIASARGKGLSPQADARVVRPKVASPRAIRVPDDEQE